MLLTSVEPARLNPQASLNEFPCTPEISYPLICPISTLIRIPTPGRQYWLSAAGGGRAKRERFPTSRRCRSALGGPDDGRVHAVREVIRPRDRDLVEPGRAQAFFVLGERERSRDAADVAPPLGALLG